METRNTLGEALFESRWKPCENWPRGAVPENYREPVRSDKPVLILSGELDPVTLPRWGELVQQSLPNARQWLHRGWLTASRPTAASRGCCKSFSIRPTPPL
ncbi:MAG: alpha/beta hydrolase [Bryobacterales bacterium]